MRLFLVPLILLGSCAPCTAQQVYLSRTSAAPGDVVSVHVSGNNTLSVSVWRQLTFAESLRVLQVGPFEARVQPARRGSHAEVASDPAFDITGDLSLEAWVRPTISGDGNFYGILSKYSVPNEAAYNIYLMPSGQLSFYLGSSGVFSTANRTLTTNPIQANQWTHVVATYDGQNKRIYINGVLDVTAPRTGPIHVNDEPVRVAAYGASGQAAEHFNGVVDSPAIYDRVLTPVEVEARFLQRADYGPGNPGVLSGAVAQWNFGELSGATLADATGNGHDLTLVNHGARGVAGPSPRTGPTASHAIRFYESDLYNPGWPALMSFTVPLTWESGLYRVQVGSRRLPLVINPRPGQERRIAVLAAYNTWLAYNNWSGQSMYTTQRGGPINYYVGMLQPNPGAELDRHSPGTGIAHLLDAERYLYQWLDANGYPFDLYTDLDLHRDPNLLAPYDVVMLNGHSEYWSHEMIDHLEAFQGAGGSVVNLSGNTMWTVVTYDPTFSIIEGRKHPHGSGTVPNNERWHSEGGILGGTLRCIGRPEHEVIGTGYGIGGGAARGWAKVLMPGHWAFAGTGVAAGDPFGTGGLNGGSMMGFEVDVVDPQWTPANVEILAIGQYPTPTFQLGITNCQSRTSWNVVEGGEIIYFDHPGGGGVFGIPSVTVGGSLSGDPVASRMLRNVLDRFLAPKAACAFRNGSGVNPTGFDCVTDPLLGTVWQTSIATVPGTQATMVGIAPDAGQLSLFGGELLLGLASPPLFSVANGAHSVWIPGGRALLGAGLSSQAFRLDQTRAGPTWTLLNAQDLTLGR